MESRRLWEVVTHNLINNKIDEATEAKRNLEEKQRSEAKERLENNIVYKPKVGVYKTRMCRFHLCLLLQERTR